MRHVRMALAKYSDPRANTFKPLSFQRKQLIAIVFTTVAGKLRWPTEHQAFCSESFSNSSFFVTCRRPMPKVMQTTERLIQSHGVASGSGGCCLLFI